MTCEEKVYFILQVSVHSLLGEGKARPQAGADVRTVG